MPPALTDYYTTYSNAYLLLVLFVVGALVATLGTSCACAVGWTVGDWHTPEPLRDCLVAAAVNSVAVGLVGPAVVCYGKVHGTPRQLHWSNLYMHAGTSALAVAAVMAADATMPLPPRERDLGETLAWRGAFLAALPLLWMVLPASYATVAAPHVKTAHVYGVRRPWAWMATTAATQAALLLGLTLVQRARDRRERSGRPGDAPRAAASGRSK